MSNVKLSTKLSCSFGVMVLLLFGVAAFYHFSINSSTSDLNDLMEREVSLSHHAGRVEALVFECRRNEKDFSASQ